MGTYGRTVLLSSAAVGVVILGAGVFFWDAPRLIPFENQQSAEFLIVGDVMLDRTIRSIAEREGYEYLFARVVNTFKEYDEVIINLECPVTGYTSLSRGSVPGDPNNTRFTCAPESVRALKESGVTLAHIGNNHILDFGRAGLGSTEHFLKQTELGYFGDVRGNDTQTLVRRINGIDIAVVSFNEFLGNGGEQAVAAIERARQEADTVIVYAHWGEEYETEPPPYIRTRAHSFADAGADLIIGSHPHVVGEHEEYKGVSIYYSLGNFVFDQYWNVDVRCGLILGVAVSESGRITVSEYTSEFRNGQVRVGACR